jgi:hypothetical protein
MVRSVVKKVMWVGRATVFMVGLSVILAVVLGLASMALAANGDPWKLGRNNVATAMTSLGGKLGVNGPMVRLTNNNGGTNDTALSLNVQSGEAPMTVNPSAGTATNLSADKLDGKDWQPEAFHLVGTTGEPPFENSWSNASDGTNAAFYRDPLGRVHLRGRITGGTIAGDRETFELPAGYGPGFGKLDFAVATSGGYGRVQIHAGTDADAFPGEAFVDIEEGQNGFVSLDGISFRCGPSGVNGCP